MESNAFSKFFCPAALYVLVLLAGCSTDNQAPVLSINVAHGVYIGNEGNFTDGNASLSLYDTATDKVYNQLFFNSNNLPLGDVLQSMTVIGDRLFLVVNNSGKVVVVEASTCRYITTIAGLTSPRYIENLGDKLYVSDLYSGSITIIDPTTYAVTGSVKIGASTEQMVRYGDQLFACSWSFNDKIYRIDTRTDKLIDSLTVTKQPNSMVLDNRGKLWVLSDGAYKGSPYGEQNAALTRVDASTFTIEQVFEFEDRSLAPSEIAINAARDTMYYISGSANRSNGIFRMEVGQTSLPTTAFIPADGALFYALGVDPSGGEVYVSDAIDYMQHGRVFRYSAKGLKLGSFEVDIIPGAFCFF